MGGAPVTTSDSERSVRSWAIALAPPSPTAAASNIPQNRFIDSAPFVSLGCARSSFMTMPELQMVRQAILRELAEALAFAGLQVQHKGTHRIMFALIRL